MEPVNPLGADARACLDAYRRQVPAAASFRRDWSRVAAAIEQPEDDEAAFEPEPEPEPEIVALPDRGALGRVAIAAGLAVAIAAAVLLLLRGVIGAATALGVTGSAPVEAIDRAADDDGERVGRVRTAAARSQAARETAPLNGDGDPERDAETAPPSTAEVAQRTATSTARAIDPAGAPGASAARDPAETADPVATSSHDAARLAEETQLLRAAREALAAGDPKDALRSLADHEERFPDGALVEERMLYRAIARCRSRAPDPAEATAFLRRFPTSPHAPRVKNECGHTP
jgi:hypothetical protein